MELKGFKKLNEAVSPELLGDDELTIFKDVVLDKELGKPLKRTGWAQFNTNQVDSSGTMASLHEVVTGELNMLPKTIILVISGTGGRARFVHSTPSTPFPVGTTIVNSGFGVSAYNVTQEVYASDTTYFELTVAYTGVSSSGTATLLGDSKNYLLAGINGKLRKSLDGTGTWSDVTDKGTPPYRMQAYADNFIFTDGLVPPFVISGNGLGDVNDLEIVAPDILLGNDGVNGVQTGQESSGVAGNLTAYAYYKWIIVYKTLTGQTSPPSYPITHYYNSASNRTTSTYQRIGFDNLPVSSDPRVTTREIYRTLANGDVFYFHSQLDNIVTSWYDDVDDSFLGSDNFDFLNIPKTAEYISLHKERVILGDLTRTVKNWVTPAYSKETTGGFNATVNGVTYAFTNLSNTLKGIKDCYAATTGGATLAAGDYTYRFVAYDIEGLMSDPIDTNVITVGGADNSVIIPAMPHFTYNFYSIKKIEIYRKLDAGDFELLMEYVPQRPTAGGIYYGTGYTDTGAAVTTIYTTNQTTDTEKCGVAFSEIGQPATFVLEDIRNIFPDDGDQITGIYDDQDGILIFKERSICKIFTGQGSPDNWRLVKTLSHIGCDEPNSLLKFSNDYVFSHQKMVYKFNSSSGLEKIGLPIIDSLQLVTAYHCATANNNWYIIGASGTCFTSGYGFLIYDREVGSWYIFNTATIPYVAHIKEQGSTTGTILTSNTDYILKYGSSGIDNYTGDPQDDIDIVPIIRTKTFGDGISLERLRKIRFNYKKVDNKTLTITVVNPDTGVTNTHADTTNATNSSDYKLYEDGIGNGGGDSLKETEKYYINITGAGFSSWGVLRLETYEIQRGKRDVRRT